MIIVSSMTHQKSSYSLPFGSGYSYLYNRNCSELHHSLSTVPKSATNVSNTYVKVCRRPKDRYSAELVLISEEYTLVQLKEKICERLNLQMRPEDFSLARFDHCTKDWIAIDETNPCEIITNLKLPFVTILIVEKYEKTSTSQKDRWADRPLTLRLCRQPMDKMDLVTINAYSSMSISQLKEEARKKVVNQRTKNLYLWTNNEWTKFECKLDDVTLAGMHFEPYSLISFETEDDPIRGLCGLTNLGNTCFMNSALQCLSNIPAFTKEILSLGNEINAPIIGAYSALIKTMWSGEHRVTTPSLLLRNICENLPCFRRYRQQDAQEFMNHFLNLIHQELTGKQTLITELFYSRIRSTVKCSGGCKSMDISDEFATFLPVPVENHINKYNLLYLQSNGEHRLISIDACARTIDALIESFIRQTGLKLSVNRIKVVEIVKNRIIHEHSRFTLLRDTNKHQLTFIELPEKTCEQRYIEFNFSNHETGKLFRPPVFLVCPSYCCHYSNLSEQISQIWHHLSQMTNVKISMWDLYVVNERGKLHRLNSKVNQDDSILSFDERIIVEIDQKWIEAYTKEYNFDRSLTDMSLTGLLEDFFREEPLDGNYYCSKCGNINGANQKADLILPLPPVLILQLKRFTYDINSDSKIDTYIDFPLRDLDLGKYISQDNNQNHNPPALYDLVAIANHTGSLVSGHYTTYARNNETERWYSFNDEIVREIIDDNDITTKNAYILVYVRKLTR